MKHLTLILLASLAAPLHAASASDGSFTIPYEGDSATIAFWCAAGTKAATEFNARGGDDIWRVSKGNRKSGEGLTFSLTRPADPIPDSFLASQTGRMSVTMARSYCDLPSPGWWELD